MNMPVMVWCRDDGDCRVGILSRFPRNAAQKGAGRGSGDEARNPSRKSEEDGLASAQFTAILKALQEFDQGYDDRRLAQQQRHEPLDDARLKRGEIGLGRYARFKCDEICLGRQLVKVGLPAFAQNRGDGFRLFFRHAGSRQAFHESMGIERDVPHIPSVPLPMGSVNGCSLDGLTP